MSDVVPSPGTVADVARNGLAQRARAEQLIANVRGAYEAADARGSVPAADAPLAEVIPLVAPLPDLEHPPTTRALDDKGRVSVRLRGSALGEVMGWEAGPLAARTDGAWVVLRPDPAAAPRRNDGHVRLGDDGRLRLPAPTRRLLGVGPGDEVAVLALPGHGAVALCHPSRLLVGAPLPLLRDRSPDEGSSHG